MNNSAQSLYRVAPWAIAITTLIVLVASAPTSFINADAVVYASQIRDGNFAERTTHLGYYILAYPVGLLPLPLTHALNLLNCFLGAGAVLLIAFIVESVFDNRLTAAIAALIVATGVHLVGNALHAEVYMAQAFFILLAVLLWLRARPGWSGSAAAVAFLVSSSSLLALPFFAMLRPKPRDLLWFGATAGLLSAAALVPVLDNYLFGARGMSDALAKGVDYKLAILKSGQDLFFGFYAFLPALVAGAVTCWRVPRQRQFLYGLAVLWLTVLLFGEKFLDVPVQLATYLLASAVAAAGVRAVASGDRWPFIAGCLVGLILLAAILFLAPHVPARFADHMPNDVMLIVFGGAMAVFLMLPLLIKPSVSAAMVFTIAVGGNLFLNWDREIETRAVLASLAETALEIAGRENTLVVAKWNTMVRLNWLIDRVAYTDYSFDWDRITGKHIDSDYERKFRAALRTNATVYLLLPSSGIERRLREEGYRREEMPNVWGRLRPS